MAAAVEAVEAFDGGEPDLRLWSGAESAPAKKIIFALKIKAGTYRERISQLTKIFKP